MLSLEIWKARCGQVAENKIQGNSLNMLPGKWPRWWPCRFFFVSLCGSQSSRVCFALSLISSVTLADILDLTACLSLSPLPWCSSAYMNTSGLPRELSNIKGFPRSSQPSPTRPTSTALFSFLALDTTSESDLCLLLILYFGIWAFTVSGPFLNYSVLCIFCLEQCLL